MNTKQNIRAWGIRVGELFLLLLVVVALSATTAKPQSNTQETPGVVHATELILLNEAGEEYGSLNSAGLTLRRGDDSIIILSLLEGGKGLEVMDPNGNLFLGIGKDDQDVTSVGLSSGTDKGVLFLGSNHVNQPRESSYLNIRGPESEGIWTGVKHDDVVGFRAYGPDFRVAASMEVDRWQNGRLVIRDQNGKAVLKSQ